MGLLEWIRGYVWVDQEEVGEVKGENRHVHRKRAGMSKSFFL